MLGRDVLTHACVGCSGRVSQSLVSTDALVALDHPIRYRGGLFMLPGANDQPAQSRELIVGVSVSGDVASQLR